MIATVYDLPSWIANNDNKPSLQVFNQLLNQSSSFSLKAETIEQPTLTTLIIQSSYTVEDWYKYNYVNFNNLWYVIKEVKYVEATNNTVEIEAEIDIYLSFIVNYFDETKQYDNLVFFKQKHLNRYTYGGDNPVINFSLQFYLKNKHPALNDIGVNLNKFCDVVNSSSYNASSVNLSNPLLINNYAGGNAYCYALCKISPSASFSGNFGNNLEMYQEIPNLVAINIAFSTIENKTVAMYPTVGWKDFLNYVGNEVYTDYILLPLPIEQAQVYNGTSLNPIITNLNELNSNSNYATSASNVTILNANNNAWINYVAWLINPQHLYYTLSNIEGTFLYYELTNLWIEPYIYQYCKFRARMSGEDSFVDLTYFNNFTPSNAALSLESFVINMNYPVTQITNINFNLMNFNNNLQPYTYNSINDAYYTINLKCVYPSVSNNWNNYLLNNLNQYHTALNIAHYAVQNSFANMVTGGIGGLFNIIGKSGLDGLGALNSFAGSETSNIFNYYSQEAQYNYLKTGKQQDMSRVGNERLATNNNVIAYNNYLLTFIFERPVQYELNLVMNYCLLNGYVLNRWEPFYFWKNRTLVNYVKCCYFTDSFLPSMNITYKKLIDDLFNKGFRVWIKHNSINYTTTPFNNIVNNINSNNELLQDNTELSYLNNQNE